MARSTRIFTDIDATFVAHPTTGDLLIKTDERAIKFAVKSLVLTNNYERLFHSEIGTPIKKLLFDNMDDLFVISLTESISQILTNYEPRIDLLNVLVIPRPDNSSVYVTVKFRIKNTERPLEVGVTLERVR